MITYQSVDELVETATSQGTNISDVVIRQQAMEQHCGIDELYQQMVRNLKVMSESVQWGLRPGHRSPSGLSGGDAHRLLEAIEQGNTVGGTTLGMALVRALAVTEVNGCAACSYAHTTFALREGMSNEEISSFLAGADDYIQPEEAKALFLHNILRTAVVIQKKMLMKQS